jgi:hypothetical protein
LCQYFDYYAFATVKQGRRGSLKTIRATFVAIVAGTIYRVTSRAAPNNVRRVIFHTNEEYFLQHKGHTEVYTTGESDQLMIEWTMKRLDDDKVSLVEFLRSIKFSQQSNASHTDECPTHFAHLDQHARPARRSSAEDAQLIRSAN